MDVEIIAQHGGCATVAERLRVLLTDRRYDHFRFVVAFHSEAGWRLLDAELREFCNRQGSIEGIVGVDLGGTTPEALRYLLGWTSSLRVFRAGRPDVVFHPKLYLFTGSDRWTAITGSANATQGGLYSNYELALELTGETENPFDEYWDSFAADDLVRGSNIVAVTPSFISSLPAKKQWSSTPAPKSKSVNRVTPLPMRRPTISATRPPKSRNANLKPRVHKTRAHKTSVAPAASQYTTFYTESWKETGGKGGPQVQIPREAITDYFGITINQKDGVIHRPVKLHMPSGVENRDIQVFLSNSTFRVWLGFMATVARPAVVRFVRQAPDEYAVDARGPTDRGYKTWLSKCTRQTNRKSRRYGFA